jgi:HPt (histidine-containing phosphotransfer) domain-containing protein
MDGIETISRIRAASAPDTPGDDSYYKNLPIVAFTANAVFGAKEMILKHGFNDYLSKPIDTAKLNTVLEKWIPVIKQKEMTEKDRQDAAADSYNGKNIEFVIQGLNTDKGLAMAGGRPDKYLKILSLFCKDGTAKIKEIKTCLETGNIPLYVIHVHALKSASANIGAIELSKTAAHLEDAGKRGDLTYVEAHTNGFLGALELLLERINSVLEKRKQDNVEKPFDAEKIKPVLLRLKEALENFDAGTINSTIQELQLSAQSGDIGAAINTISDRILFSEFEEAVAVIDTLL